MHSPVTGEIALTGLTPMPASTAQIENGVAMMIYKGIGLGEVIYWAFDPFQGTLRASDSRGPLFISLFRGEKTLREQYRAVVGVGSGDEYNYGYGAGYSPHGGAPDELDSSPFSVSIPPTITVFFILALYLVMVVPINFFLLGKKGRGHLAWVTAPLIGVAFAGVFFFISRGLYSKSLSRATTSVVFAHEGADHAYVIGEQQFFFPRGERYDLGLKGVEHISQSRNYEYYYGGTPKETGFGDDVSRHLSPSPQPSRDCAPQKSQSTGAKSRISHNESSLNGRMKPIFRRKSMAPPLRACSNPSANDDPRTEPALESL